MRKLEIGTSNGKIVMGKWTWPLWTTVGKCSFAEVNYLAIQPYSFVGLKVLILCSKDVHLKKKAQRDIDTLRGSSLCRE